MITLGNKETDCKTETAAKSGKYSSTCAANLSAKRVCISLGLAVLIFLVLNYNLTYPKEGQVTSAWESIMFRFGTYGFSGNLYTLGIAMLLYLWFSVYGELGLFFSKSLTLLSVIFGLLNAAAMHLFYRNTLLWHAASAMLLFLLQTVIYALLFLMIARVLLSAANRIGHSAAGSTSAGDETRNSGKFGFVCFAVILLGWLPWLISYYPASMEWDVYDPIMRYLGMRTPSDHHPWFYSCVVGAFYQLGLNLGDKNVGIFIYIVLRALVMSAIYARCAVLQRKNGVPRPLYLLTVLFFALTPVWGAYAKHAFKDSIGAAFFCWYIISLVEVVLALREDRLKVWPCLENSLAGLFGCLFRNNTWYVVLPVTVVLVLIVLFRKQCRRFAAVLILGVVLFQGYRTCIFDILHVEPGNAREALSVPFQQTARTYRLTSHDQFTEEETAVLEEYFLDNALTHYDPLISDPVKANNENYSSFRDYLPYLKVWAGMGVRFPRVYLEALIAHSSGYYAFTPEYTEAQYYGYGSHANVGMTIFSWVEDPRFPDELLCHYMPGMAVFRSALDSWAEIWHQIPVLNLTDMKPLYTWLIVLLGWFWFRRKEWLNLLPVFACTLMVLTCVASPVNDCFRYYAPVAAAFPGLLSLLGVNHVTEQGVSGNERKHDEVPERAHS